MVQLLIVFIIGIFILISCSNNKSKITEIPSMIGSIEKSPDSAPPAMDPATNTPVEAMKQIQVIQQQLNQDIQYSLTLDEASDLEAQGIIDSKNDIKGWVK